MQSANSAACLAILVLCLVRGGSAAYSMAETCQYMTYQPAKSTNNYIANPNDCAGWGYCYNGTLQHTGTCGNGLLYNARNGMCEPADDVTCVTNITQVCSNKNTPAYMQDPNSCGRYCYCNGTGAYSNCDNCPTGQVFDQDATSCKWEKQYPCSSNSICRLVQDNVFVGNPSQCGGYIRCLRGASLPGNCSTGYFDYTKGGCTTVRPTQCYGSGTGGTGSPVNVPSFTTTLCGGYAATPPAVDYVADGITCYGFYACVNKTYGEWGSCPFATHFDATAQKCVTPYTVACTFDRCGNLNLNFTTVAYKNCTEYNFCSNGQTVTQGSCSDVDKNFPYYDEYGGACVASMPNEAICTPPS